MIENTNPFFLADFYKVGHCIQYPEKTEFIQSNFTPRFTRHAEWFKSSDRLVWLGGEAVLIELVDLFNRNFFQVPFDNVRDEYTSIVGAAIGIDSAMEMLSRMEKLHKLGTLPLEVRCLPEGSLINPGVPCMTIQNTHPEFAWLVGYLETFLSAELWKVCTVATIARKFRSIVSQYNYETSDNPEAVDYQCHDFSQRGMSGWHDFTKSAIGHLAAFNGTDSIAGIAYAKGMYPVVGDFIAGSIPATEHSVMCAGGKDGEFETIQRIIRDVYPSGFVSVVCDSYDYFHTLSVKIPLLKEVINARNGKTVIRPDSGNPVHIIAGYEYVCAMEENWESAVEAIEAALASDNFPEYVIAGKLIGKVCYANDFSGTFTILPSRKTKEEIKGTIEVLYEIFGGKLNSKGYKTLSDKVGIIFGDSITLQVCEETLFRIKRKGFSSECVVFGVGSYSYQYITRDTFGFAMKATWMQIDGKSVDIYKAPKTDSSKQSAKGRVAVTVHLGEYKAIPEVDCKSNSLAIVLADGVVQSRTPFDTIRSRVRANLPV